MDGVHEDEGIHEVTTDLFRRCQIGGDSIPEVKKRRNNGFITSFFNNEWGCQTRQDGDVGINQWLTSGIFCHSLSCGMILSMILLTSSGDISTFPRRFPTLFRVFRNQARFPVLPTNDLPLPARNTLGLTWQLLYTHS